MWLNLFYLIAGLAGFVGEAFFAVAENALVASDKLLLLDQKEKGPGILPLLQMLSHPQRISQTLLVGSVFSVGVGTTFSFLLLFRLSGGTPGLLLLPVFAFLLILIIVFAEVLPRAIFSDCPEETALRIARPLAVCMSSLRVVIDPALRFFETVRTISGLKGKEETPFVEDEDLEWIRRFVRGSETLRREEVRIIRKIIDFSEIRVRDVCVPLEQVIAVEERENISRAIRKIRESGFTRLPVYRKEEHEIVGILHALDLFSQRGLDTPVDACCRQPFFVSEETLIRDLFRDLQRLGIVMAVVRNHTGRAVGIVTMEDLLEEIFGEIEDEFDLKDQFFRKIGRGEYLVDTRVDLDALQEALQLPIPRNGYRTLNGYILHYLRRVPQEGERFTIGDLMFKVELADQRRIYKLFVRKLEFPR
ncbi:MAG: HlyC/CorC family transporter [Deltaproteobacteria bacterium]|nr:HlyC/CorC family transporter [Deltaproteobacteria bacterium]